MANKCESLINVVISSKRKMLIRLDQNGEQSGCTALASVHTGRSTAGGKAEPKSPDKLSMRNVVSPNPSLERAGSRKVSRWGCGGRDCGKSEGHPVMGRIGINVPTRKCADFHMVARHKRAWSISEGGKANERNSVCARRRLSEIGSFPIRLGKAQSQR